MKLPELFQKLGQGYFVTPEIQRGFVWRNPQVRELMDSIYRDYPIGSIVYWEMPNSFLTVYQEIIAPLVDGLPDANRRYLVIDGRQRLTSLLLVSSGHVQVGDRRRQLALHYNAVEEEFEIGNPSKYLIDEKWYSVSRLIAGDAISLINEKKAQGGDDPLKNTAIPVLGN